MNSPVTKKMLRKNVLKFFKFILQKKKLLFYIYFKKDLLKSQKEKKRKKIGVKYWLKNL